MPHRISFVSDLHMFARRSDAPRYAEAIRAAARRSSVMVLGGDIFDFSWSTRPRGDATVEAAYHWLQRLAAEHPRCRFHYLLGNHDYCQPFIDCLEEHSAAIPNFAWHHFYLRLGQNVFLHGDVAEKQMTTHARLPGLPLALAPAAPWPASSAAVPTRGGASPSPASAAGLYPCTASCASPGVCWLTWKTQARARRRACGTSTSATSIGGCSTIAFAA